jgi:DNA-directed RNA polymerase subunit RPC12/RpoP
MSEFLSKEDLEYEHEMNDGKIREDEVVMCPKCGYKNEDDLFERVSYVEGESVEFHCSYCHAELTVTTEVTHTFISELKEE